MHRIEPVKNPYALPEGAICLGRTGWDSRTEEVQLQLPVTVTLEHALNLIWEQHKGLLGAGSLVFAQTGFGPAPTGYVVFVPSEDLSLSQ